MHLAYIAFRDWGESNCSTVLNDRSASAQKIYIYVFAVVDTNLSRGNYKHTVLNCSDVCRACNVTGDNKRVLDVLEGQAGEWLTMSSRNGHVDNTPVQLGHRARGRSMGGGGREDYV
jgi:hypothetical protein